MEWNELFGRDHQPEMKEIAAYVNNDMWEMFTNRIEEEYEITPSIEYSRCSMQPGWNVKYKKSGKALCTLYPLEGKFLVLITIGSKEIEEAEFMMPACSQYMQNLFQNSQPSNGAKWLMVDVKDKDVVEDIMNIAYLRKKPKNKK